MAQRVSLTVRASVTVIAGVLALAACGDDGGSQETFCARSAEVSEFADTFGESFDPLDVDAALAAFIEARNEERALRDAAPEVIRSDFDVLIDYLDQLIDGLEAVDPDSTERPPIYDELRSRADEVTAASGRIEQYVRTNCTGATTTG